MRLRMLTFWVLLVASSAGATELTLGYSPRTGDVWLDVQLGQMNDYGYRDRDGFLDEMVLSFGGSRPWYEDMFRRQHWMPGDLYYACALAQQLHRPCLEVSNEYARDRGQGWGVVAKRLGIKPGSAAFFALKAQVGKTHGRMGKGKSVPPGQAKKAGNQGNAPSESDRDDEHGHSDDHGKGKGHDHG